MLSQVGLLYSQKMDDPAFKKFQEQVAFVDAYTRNLDANSYVREMKLVEFSSKGGLPKGVGFAGMAFGDEGKNNDQVAGDGIYTSTEKYGITTHQEANAVGERKSVLSKIYVDNNFKFDSELKKGGYVEKITVKCRIIRCGCPCKTFTCNACEWFGWSCLTWEWCEVEIGW